MLDISCIVAYTARSRGIGASNSIPWRIPADTKHFKATTTRGFNQNVVIMGRNTWLSMSKRMLSGRLNIVLSKTNLGLQEMDDVLNNGIFQCNSLETALAALDTRSASLGEIFIIGGVSLYEQAMRLDECRKLYVTEIMGEEFKCDRFFPEIDLEFFQVSSSSPISTHDKLAFQFLEFSRVKPGVPRNLQTHEEYQYLNLVSEVIRLGHRRDERTGTGSLALFGKTMKFSLRENTFPLLTTKRVFWKGVAQELLWFISGNTSNASLTSKGVNIWNGNSSRAYLDSINLFNREEGDLGPIYGFQWRHFGAEYKTMHDSYEGQGVDQLARAIELIKTRPHDRRILVSAWNPPDIPEMALPPCHVLFQFFVDGDELSCMMYQRSCDIGLGVPFNIASYALLTRLVAQVCGLKAGDFIHVLGDTHVYSNHVVALEEQLTRTPREFPKLEINPEITDIDKFRMDDFKLVGYLPHGPIKMGMAV